MQSSHSIYMTSKKLQIVLLLLLVRLVIKMVFTLVGNNLVSIFIYQIYHLISSLIEPLTLELNAILSAVFCKKNQVARFSIRKTRVPWSLHLFSFLFPSPQLCLNYDHFHHATNNNMIMCIIHFTFTYMLRFTLVFFSTQESVSLTKQVPSCYRSIILSFTHQFCILCLKETPTRKDKNIPTYALIYFTKFQGRLI